jgi:hypothetical protein
MLMEFTRVLFGLTLALFHAQVADFLRKQDRALGATFRELGVTIPDALPERTSHNLFFLLGVAVAVVSLARIWLTLH